MTKLLGRLALLGALAGGAIAVLGYLRKTQTQSRGSVQIVFDDGSSTSPDVSSPEGGEFVEIARKVLETGV